MKLNLQVFKKHAGWWLGGAVVIFLFFYLRANAAANAANVAASSGTSVVDPNVLAAQTQIATAQLAANTQLGTINAQANAATTIAQLQAQQSIDNTGVAAQVAEYTANIQGNTNIAGITAQQNIAQINAQAGVDTAQIASQTLLGQTQIQAGEFQAQVTSNQNMFLAAVQNQTTQALINQVGNLLPVDRDNGLALLASTITGTPTNYYDAGSGSFSTGGIPGTTPAAPLQPSSINSNRNTSHGGGSGLPILGVLGSLL